MVASELRRSIQDLRPSWLDRRHLARATRRLLRELALDVGLALKEATRRKRRSAAAVGAVAFGIVALMLSAGFIEWIFWAMREGTIRAGLGHVQVSRPGYHVSGLSDPLAYLVPDATSLQRAVDALRDPQVETVAPRITFFGLVSRGEATLSFQGEGVEPGRERPLARALNLLAGRGLSEQPGLREVLVGEGLAANLGVTVGEPLVLLVNSPTAGVNAVEATVVGVFATESKAQDDVAVRLPIDLARQLLRMQGTTRWILTVADTAQAPALMQALRRSLPESELAVTPWWELADFYNKTVVLFSRQVLVLKLIVGLIVVLTISNTLTIGVVERTAEIGTVLALGRSRRQVLRGFVVEGVVLGMIGALVGVALGVGAAAAISAIGIPMPPPPGMSHGYVGAIRLTPALVAEGVLLALASAFAGALLPAWRASRMTITDAIRRGQ